MECYASKMKLLGWFFLAGVMVGLCYFITTLPDLPPKMIGWFGVVFFGLGLIMLPVQCLKWGPFVIINETGIEDRRLRIGIFLWEDIIHVSSYAVEGGGMLYITVKNPEKYLSRMRWWNPRVAKTLAPVEIKCFALTPGFEEMFRYIQFRMRDHALNDKEERQEESNEKGYFSQLDP